MNSCSLSHLHDYIAALRTYLALAREATDRSNTYERLSIADQMRADIENGNLGAAYAVASSEQRALGWGGFYGPGGDAVHTTFHRYADVLKAERLNALPDAGFEH
jgi:hypothetical protein